VDPEPSRGPELSGLDNPGRVDLVSVPAVGPVELVLHAAGEWDGSEQRQILLQEKLNRYLEYVVDGELAEAYPAATGRDWIVVILCDHAPDTRTSAYFQQADRELQRSGGGLQVQRL